MNKEQELKLLGQCIRRRRKELGLSQAQLGYRVDKDQQSIHKVEVGQFNPSYIYLLEIAKGLEISLSDLLRQEEIPAS